MSGAPAAGREAPNTCRGGYSPYLKYAFDGQSTLHSIATEDHPRNYNNSIYYGYLRDGEIYAADGPA